MIRQKRLQFHKKKKMQETSPHFLWSHTWTNASLDFFCAVSSGQPVICLKSLASICVLTGIFCKWPRGIVIPQRSWDVPACTGEGMGSIAWLNVTYIHVLDIHICFSFPVQRWALCGTSWTVTARLMEINHQRAITINNSEIVLSHPIIPQQW